MWKAILKTTLVAGTLDITAACLANRIWLNSLLISVVAWIVTTQIIIPLSQLQPPPFKPIKVLTAICILIVCIGLPIAVNAKRFFHK